jgi:hypothetical protein
LPSTGPTSAVDRPDNQTTRQFAVDGPDISRRQARQPDNLPSTGPTSAVNRPDNQKTRQFAAVGLPTNAGVDFVTRQSKLNLSGFKVLFAVLNLNMLIEISGKS